MPLRQHAHFGGCFIWHGAWSWHASTCKTFRLTAAKCCSNTVVLLTAAVILARICFAEAGPHATPDCAAIHQVIVNGSVRRHVRYETYARLYAAEHFRTSRTDSRRWIADLTQDAHEPAGWPAQASWSHVRPLWLQMIDHARAVQSGDVQHTCEVSPVHWGAPRGEDLRRAIRAGWIRVHCDGTRNAFWAFPNRRVAAVLSAATQ